MAPNSTLVTVKRNRYILNCLVKHHVLTSISCCYENEKKKKTSVMFPLTAHSECPARQWRMSPYSWILFQWLIFFTLIRTSQSWNVRVLTQPIKVTPRHSLLAHFLLDFKMLGCLRIPAKAQPLLSLYLLLGDLIQSWLSFCLYTNKRQPSRYLHPTTNASPPLSLFTGIFVNMATANSGFPSSFVSANLLLP